MVCVRVPVTTYAIGVSEVLPRAPTSHVLFVLYRLQVLDIAAQCRRAATGGDVVDFFPFRNRPEVVLPHDTVGE